MREVRFYEQVFARREARFDMERLAHNGLVPGSSPGRPTNLFKELAAVLRRSRGFAEPKPPSPTATDGLRKSCPAPIAIDRVPMRRAVPGDDPDEVGEHHVAMGLDGPVAVVAAPAWTGGALNLDARRSIRKMEKPVGVRHPGMLGVRSRGVQTLGMVFVGAGFYSCQRSSAVASDVATT